MKFSLEIKALAWALEAAFLSLCCAGLLAAVIRMMSAPAEATPAETFGPMASPELVAEGHQFYDLSCSHCHGDDATGDEGPNLHNLALSNAHIVRTIKNGIKGEMPTFAKKYDDRQIAALVSYLRTLR